MDFDGFLSQMTSVKSVGLTAPAGADGDSVGTQCALREFLMQWRPDLKVEVINEEPCPARYTFLPQSEYFLVSRDLVEKRPAQDWPEMLICVDGNESRIGESTSKLWESAKLKGQIDHHAVGDSGPYDLRLYDPKAAATTEIVFKMIKASGLPFTPGTAQAIYVGLIFDTGMFKHSNTSPSTLRMAAELLENDFDHTITAEKAMLERSVGGLELLKIFLASSQREFSGRYIWGALEHADLKKSGAVEDDREGIIDTLFLTHGCEIAAFFFEKDPGEWKLSFRARNGHDVAALARRLNPQGGGHRAAAGCSLEGKTFEVLEKTRAEVGALLGG